MQEASICWLIRGGEKGRHVGRFLTAGVVALGWPNVPGLHDLRDLDADDLRALLVAADIRTPGHDANELLRFRSEPAVNDVVITPDVAAGDVLVGRVTGPYEYRDPSPVDDYRHVRTVHWLARFERAGLPGELVAELRWQRASRRLTQQDGWSTLARRAAAGDGRAPHERLAIESPRP